MKKVMLIDIGGTAIKYAVGDFQGNLFGKGTVETPKDSPDSLLAQLKSLDKAGGDTVGVSISMPGVIDAKRGFANTGGSLRYIRNLALQNELVQMLGKPVLIENDAKCAALAELGYGVLRQIENALSVKAAKPVRVSRKMRRNPVQNNTNLIFMKLIDQIHEVGRITVSGGGHS